MRVSIDHRELKTGVIRKTIHYIVDLKVDFSAEEAAIVKTRGLGDIVIMERDQPSYLTGNDPYPLFIKNLVGGKVNATGFTTPIEAKRYDADLKEKLKELKAYIDGNAETAEKSSSFEL